MKDENSNLEEEMNDKKSKMQGSMEFFMNPLGEVDIWLSDEIKETMLENSFANYTNELLKLNDYSDSDILEKYKTCCENILGELESLENKSVTFENFKLKQYKILNNILNDESKLKLSLNEEQKTQKQLIDQELIKTFKEWGIYSLILNPSWKEEIIEPLTQEEIEVIDSETNEFENSGIDDDVFQEKNTSDLIRVCDNLFKLNNYNQLDVIQKYETYCNEIFEMAKQTTDSRLRSACYISLQNTLHNEDAIRSGLDKQFEIKLNLTEEQKIQKQLIDQKIQKRLAKCIEKVYVNGDKK